MGSKIRVVILRTNRTVKRMVKDIKNGLFRYNKGIYLMPKQYVSLASKNGSVSKEAELIFYENDPLPINIDDREKKSGAFLDEIVISKVLASTGKPKSMMFTIIGEYLRSPSKMFMLVSVVLIGSVMIYSIITGGI